jgi:hypothetical protein
MPEPFSVPELSVVAPSMNVTVPVGAVDPLVVTVAVNATEDPDMEGFALEARVVLVAASVGCWTVWVRTGEVLPLSFASPA